MRLAANVTVGDEVTLIVAKPVDILKWELGTKRRITDGMGYGDLMQIMHSSATRQGLTDKSFNDWAATLDDFDPEAPDEDPTQTVPGDAT